jgi:tRNA wybutosine-synthesizing protein 1
MVAGMDYVQESARRTLTKQGYHLAAHGAVKPCLWLNRSLRGGDQCYKHHFYGISSHKCVQMTPTLSCNHLCLHCWRPVDEPVALPKAWIEPKELLDDVLREQQRILSGYGGSATTDLSRLEEARHPAHVAISLMGEPTLYPYLDELIREIGRRGMTSFLVTNGTKPEVLENLSPTQLYLSLNAPNEELYQHISNPSSSDLWEKILESLSIMKDATCRTVVRMTLARRLNMADPEVYSRLLEQAEPDFVEAKAYMHLGRSRARLSREAMPEHAEILAFAGELSSTLGYKIEDDVPLSRVVLLTSGKISRNIFDA